MKEMMLTEKMTKQKKIVMMNKKEERKIRIKKNLSLSPNLNLKVKRKKMQNLKKNQSVNNNDI